MKKVNKTQNTKNRPLSARRLMKAVFLSFILFFAANFGTQAAALSGTYTIGAGGSYTTFTLAAAALTTNGVSGPVTFNVSAATFTESVTIGAITGVSATNTITFKGAGRNSTTLTSAVAAGTVVIQNASYVKFDQMAIVTTRTTSGDLINAQGSTNCSITNSIVKGPTGTTVIYLIYDNLATGLTVNNCYIYGGYYGVYANGSANSAAYGNLTCTNNRFIMQDMAAYYAYYGFMDNFSYNVVDTAFSTLTYGMVNQYENGPLINGNKFYAAATYPMYMYEENFYPVTGYSPTATITNNFFTNGKTYGVFDQPVGLSSTTGGWVFAFNTIYNTTATSYGAFIEPQNCGTATCTFASNIIYSTKGTDALYMECTTSGGGVSEWAQYDGNDIYFTTGSIIFYYGTTATTYTTYATYAAALQGYGLETSGTNFNPTFVSTAVPYDLHLSPTTTGPIGVWAGGVKTDIDRNSRIKYTAAGAAENFYGITANDASVTTLIVPPYICPGTSANISVKIADLGTNNISSVSIGWSWDGVTQTPVSVGSITIPTDVTVTLGSESFATGATHSLKAWPISPNGTTDGNHLNDTLVSSLSSALPGGTYTINPSGNSSTNFTSFTAAVNFMNTRGICGPVVFNVSRGTYNEQVSLNNVPGSSSTNTITFDGGDSTKTILTYNSVAATPYTFKLNGANYVTLKRMSILDPGTVNAYAVYMTNGASYNTVSGCIIKVSNSVTNTGTLIPVAIIGVTYTTAGNNGNYNVINNNIIDGGWANVAMYGTSTTVLCAGNQVTNNVMTGAYLFGINATFQSGFLLSHNTIVLRVTASGSTVSTGGCVGSYSGTLYAATVAISAVNCTNHVISNNIVSAYSQGILDQNADVSVTGGKSYIYNNVVYGNYSPNANTYGIYLNVGYNTAIWYNTIYFTTVGYGLYIVNSGTASQGADVRNNIVYKSGTCGYCAYVASSAYVTNFDYNDFYNLGGTGFYVYFNGTAYTTMAALKAGNNSFNQNSFSADPGFASLSPGALNFHMCSSCFGLYGQDVSITVDKDGNPRCKAFPNIGAYETNLGKGSAPVKFFITSNIYPGSPSYVYQTGKAGEPKTYKWYLKNSTYLSLTYISDSAVLVSTQFTSGSNTLKLVTTSCTGIDSFQQTFNVASPTNVPSTDFVANKNYVSTGDVVLFQDLSTNGPTGWTWTISPDSSVYGGAKAPNYNYVSGSSRAQNPQVQFLQSGTYQVCLFSKNTLGAGNQVCKTNYITVIPSINIGSVSVVNSAEGNIFDDGGPSANYLTKATPSTLIAPCADSVYLTFSVFDLNCGTSFLQIYQGKDATGKRLDACGGSGISSGLTGGPTGGTFCSSSCMPNVFKPDTFKAKSSMFIQMNDGATSLGAGFAAHWWSKPLTGVQKDVPSFTVSGSGDSVCLNSQIDFVNTTKSTPGDQVTFLWDLDGDLTDGFECTGACSTVYWPYFLPGPVTVTLIANNCGGSDTFQKTLTIFNPDKPKTAISADDRTPGVGDVVFLTAPIKQCVDDYIWTITNSTIGASGYASFVNKTTNQFSNPQVTFSDTGYYDVKLYTDNDDGGQKDSLTLKKYIHVHSSYCQPDVASLNQGMGISGFTLNTLTNTTKQAQQPYTSFTADAGLTTTLAQGVTYSLSVSRDPSLAYEPLNRSVYIDWNEDGNFTDAGDKVAEDSNSMSNTWNGSFTVPRNAKVGATTIRVAVNLGTLSNKPCGQNEFGEYQDYRIYVIPYNVAPVITLFGHHGLSDTIKVEQGYPYTQSGDSAYSNRYGVITKDIVETSRPIFNGVVPGVYIFAFNVTDSLGNKAITQYRVVEVTGDKTPPVLSIGSPDTTVIEVTKTPLHPLPIPQVKSAIDIIDGNLKTAVTIDTSKTTTAVLGTYTITYAVTDLSNNTATAYRYLKVIDTIKPVMVLNGKQIDTVEVNATYNDAGVVATDNYYDAATLGALVVVKGTVDTTKTGTYLLTYYLTDPSGNVAATVSRTVVVIDGIKPTITLNGATVDSIAVFSIYQDPGVTVSDNYNKASDIAITKTGSFYTQFPAGTRANLLGSYTITYLATDKAGNQASISRIVYVRDWTAPVITLIGSQDVSVCRWADYVDAGYTLSDNYDDSSAVKVIASGTFFTEGGTTIENLLTISYKAIDKSGNVGYSAVRNILVKSTDEWPCSLSGIQPGLSLDKYITVFPNPNSGVFTVSASLPQQQKVHIYVTNMLGQELAAVYNGVLNQNNFQVDLSHQPSGIYLLNFVTDNQIVTKRIEITK